MQVSISNHKITESAIKNLEVQVGQLEENSNGNFVANTEKNPKEEYKVLLTWSKRKKDLVGEELVDGVVKDVSDEEGDIGEKKEVENKEKKMSEDNIEKNGKNGEKEKKMVVRRV